MALLGLVAWGFGIPLISWFLLYLKHHSLNSNDTKDKFGFLYNGYKTRSYYWESVVMLRKVAMILINTFLASLGRIVQALAILLLLLVYLHYTLTHRPYISRRLNDLEVISLVTSFITIYAGVFFLSSRDSTEQTFDPNLDCKPHLT